MSGKGDKPRPVDMKRFQANWERIFGGEGKVELLRKLGEIRNSDGGSTPPTSTNKEQYGKA